MIEGLLDRGITILVMDDLGWIGLLRHGQSMGNVARDEAELAGREVIDMPMRDADVPLTAFGVEQAVAAGRWLAARPPDRIGVSSYLRAVDTARIASLETSALGCPPLPSSVDERLRDRELGVLDLLTSHGVRIRYPEEQARKQHLGKFYYRPPGGESWADVVFRIRSFLDEAGRRIPGQNLLLVAHEMTLFALRYLLEQVPEVELLKVARETLVPNGSITIWERDESGRYRMTVATETRHLRENNPSPTLDRDGTHFA